MNRRTARTLVASSFQSRFTRTLDGSGAPWEPRVESRVADVAPRFAFKSTLFLESLLAIGFGQYPRADGDREHDDDHGTAVALEFRHIHAPRDAYAANPI